MDESMNKKEEVHLFLPTDDRKDENVCGEEDWISLEYDLIEDVASTLEEFVRLNHVKRFDEAKEVYQNCLVNYQDWFPVVAEFAEHLLLRRSYKELADFCEENMSAFTDSREMQVLIIMRIIADVHLNNSFQDAIAQISIIWHYFPIDYSKTMPIDAEIQILELLLQASVLTERYRGPLLINLEPLPKVLRDTGWEYFIAWSHRLFSHGYYWEAHRIFRWLLEVLPRPEATILLKSDLEATRQMKTRSEALETSISASLQVLMQHLEGVGSPDDSEWNDIVTQATFANFSGHKEKPFFFESDKAVLTQLQDVIQCPLPLIHNERNNADSLNPLICENFDLEQCWIDLSEVSDFSRHDVDGLFRMAAKEGHALLVKLLSKTEAFESKDSFRQRPLHLAAANGHDEVIRNMIDSDAKIDCEDWFRRTPIYLAARNGHKLVVQLLLQNLKSKASKQEELWNLALRCAIENGREAVVQGLLNNKGATTEVDRDVLILAVRQRNCEIVRLLLEDEFGLDINAQDDWGWTPLMSAIREDQDAIVVLLKKNGAHLTSSQPDYDDQNCQTPLLYVTKQGHDALANLLLLRQDALETDPDGDQNQPSLLGAATIAHEKIVKALLIHKDLEVNTKDKEGRTALSYAASSGKEKIAKALLEHKDIEVNSKDRVGRTALSYAAESGNENQFKAMLEEGVDVKVQSKGSGNALQTASKTGHVEVVKLLLKHGADVNASGRYYRSALQAASTHGHTEVVKLLLEHEADVNASSGNHKSALQAASTHGHTEIVKLLLEHGADVNASDGYYESALQAASDRGHVEVVELLLKCGADVNASGGYYDNVLQATSYLGHKEVVERLLEQGCSGNHNSALQAASTHGHTEIVKLLLEHGADVNASDGYYESALQAASTNGQIEVVKVLLESGADINGQGGHHGSALQVASKNGHKEVVELLLDGGADVNAHGGAYGNALAAASDHGHKEAVKLLLERGADVNAQSGHYGSALQAASAHGHKKAVKLLLEHGADVNAQGGHYESALQAASAHGHTEVVKLLLEHGADVNASGGYEGSALQVASTNGDKEAVKLLLEHGADVNARGGHYESALQAASDRGHVEVVELFLKGGAYGKPTRPKTQRLM